MTLNDLRVGCFIHKIIVPFLVLSYLADLSQFLCHDALALVELTFGHWAAKWLFHMRILLLLRFSLSTYCYIAKNILVIGSSNSERTYSVLSILVGWTIYEYDIVFGR